MAATFISTGPKPARSALRVRPFPEASRRSKFLLALLAAWLLSLPALIGLIEWRRLTFSRISAEHRIQVLGFYKHSGFVGPIFPQPHTPDGRTLSEAERRKDLWNADLFMKYAEAAARPWFPVWPDPPEPH